MYRCPKCGSLCNFSLITTWDGAMQSWVCPCCGWSNLNVETKTNTSTKIGLMRTINNIVQAGRANDQQVMMQIVLMTVWRVVHLGLHMQLDVF